MGRRTEVNRRRSRSPEAAPGERRQRERGRSARGARPGMGNGGGGGVGGEEQGCFPGNPGSPAPSHGQQPRAPQAPASPRHGRAGGTHLGQAAPVLGVLAAQHLLQLVHPGPVRAAAAPRRPPPVAPLRPRPFRVRAPPRCPPTWPRPAQAPTPAPPRAPGRRVSDQGAGRAGGSRVAAPEPAALPRRPQRAKPGLP